MIRIYTRIVLDMTQDDLPVIESDSFIYDGPMALCVDGRGDPNSNDGRGDSESGNGTSGSDGGVGSDGGDFGGLDYGGGIGSIGGFSNATSAAAEAGASSFGGLAGNNRGEFGGMQGVNTPADVARSMQERNKVGAPSLSGYETMSATDYSDALASAGVQATKGPGGYYDKDQNKVAYSSGSPTSYGAQAAGLANDSMSWDGAKAVNDAVSTAKSTNRQATAKSIQSRVAAALKNPAAYGLDPHQAMAAYNDVMHGMYDKAVSVGAMNPAEVSAVQDAYSSPMEAVGRAFGVQPTDITTPYEKSVTAISAGLVDPATGQLTTKGWMNVAAPALGMLAGPLAGLGMSMAGIPGAIAGAVAPAAVNAYSSSGVPSSDVATAVGEAASAIGVNAGPVAAGLSYGAALDTMSGAQNYAGTQPDKVSAVGSQRNGGEATLESLFSTFFTKGEKVKDDGLNPAFKTARTGKSSISGSTPKTQAPQGAVTAVDLDSIFGSFFTRG